MKRLACFIAAFALASCTTGAASWKIGASAGITAGGDVGDSDFAPGAQATWILNDTWALELGVFQFADSGGDVEEGIRWVSDLDATPLTLTAIASRPLADRLRGYVGAGVAYYLIDAKGSAERTDAATADDATWSVTADNGYGVHVLAGLDFALAEAWSAFADVRYALMAYDYQGAWTERFGGETYSGVEDDTEDYAYGLVRIGLQRDL